MSLKTNYTDWKLIFIGANKCKSNFQLLIRTRAAVSSIVYQERRRVD